MEYNYMANILMLIAIVSSVVATTMTEEELKIKESDVFNVLHDAHQSLGHGGRDRMLYELNTHDIYYRLCPPFGKKTKFEVETISTRSMMFGCAYMGLEHVPLFHLLLERPEEQIAGHGNCRNTYNMDHYTFECLSKSNPTNKDELAMGWQYVSLLEHTEDKNKNNTQSYRCLLYDMFDEDARKLRTIRMVISKPVIGEKFNVDQCKGLSRLLGRDFLPMIPEGKRYWSDGSMYLYSLGKKAKIFYTTTMNPVTISPNTTTSFPTITTTIRRPTTTTTKRPTTTTTRRPTTTTTSRPTTTTTKRPTTTTTRRPTTTTTTTKRPSINGYHYSMDDYFLDLVLSNLR